MYARSRLAVTQALRKDAQSSSRAFITLSLRLARPHWPYKSPGDAVDALPDHSSSARSPSALRGTDKAAPAQHKQETQRAAPHEQDLRFVTQLTLATKEV